jgi:hypothetical protein
MARRSPDLATSPAVSPSCSDFIEFLKRWNQLQNLTTPHLHLEIGAWLQRAWRIRRTRLLLQVFRGAGKSTLVGLFCAWLLSQDPEKRILVVSAEQALACKMTRNVRQIMQSCDETRPLCTRRSGEWAADRFTVERRGVYRDPSLLARGITSNLTGSRADIVICDDVEVPTTADSCLKRGELRTMLAETGVILVPGGTLLYVGTPHSYYSIYAARPRAEMGEERPFLSGYDRLSIPVLRGGESVWPERFSVEHTERSRQEIGPLMFRSQMMLQPVDPRQVRLDPGQLERYEAELEFTTEQAGAGWVIQGTRLRRSACWWDPALGRDVRADNSVVAVMFEDDNGKLWLQEVRYLHSHSPGPGEPSEVDQLCEQVCDLLERNRLRSIHVESNGQGQTYESILKTTVRKRGLPVLVAPIANSRAKSDRIVHAFDAALGARRLRAHASVWQTPFIQEMRNWQMHGGGHDDGLDAVAACIDLLPLRSAALSH